MNGTDVHQVIFYFILHKPVC